MNVHKRIWKTLNHEEPDRVPTFTQSIEQPFCKRYDEEVGVPDEIVDAMLPGMTFDLIFAKALGYDSKWVHLSSGSAPKREHPELPELPEGQKVNASGHVYVTNKRGQAWYYDGALKTPELIKAWIPFIKDYIPPDASYYKNFKDMWDKGIDNGLLPIPTVGGVVYTSWSAIGMKRFGYMVRKHFDLVSQLFHAWGDRTIEAQSILFEQGVDMVFICEDFAQKDRLMMSPKHWEELTIPVYKKITKNAHKHGAKLLVHTDGNIDEAFPGMIEAGVDAAEPLEYESGMRLKPLKEKYGDKITLIGNVPASEALCIQDVDYTVNITKTCIKDAAEGGGFILSQGANLLANTKIENVQAMIETVKRYGTYPIKL
ncbi:MAG: uroporphyrinogen decarboxylase family protein [Candidatus Hodarchaeota archaeon]